MKWTRQNIAFVFVLGILAGSYLTQGLAIQTVSSFSGTTKTMGDDFIEVQDLNVTYFYLQDENRTDAILNGNFTGIGLETPWLELGGTNRTTWPSASGSGGLDEYSFSYLIFKNATNTYAINGSTAIIEFSGDSTTVIQSALTSVGTAGGGKVFVKNENYSLTTNLKVYNNTIFEGESWNTILTGPTDLGTWTCIIENENVRTVSANSFITIRNFQIDGQKDSINPSAYRPGGIGFSGVQNVVIENNYIHDVVLFCVRIFQWETYGAINRDIIIRNNFFENADFNGLMAEAEEAGDTSRILVEGNYVTGTDTGLSCYKASFVSFVNNILWNNTNNRLFTNFIDIAMEQESTDILVAGNICMGSGPYTEGGGGQNVNGIEMVHSTCDRALITNNYIQDKTYVGISAVNNSTVIGNRIHNSPTVLGSYAITGKIVIDNTISGLWRSAWLDISVGECYVAHNQVLDIHASGYGVFRISSDGNYIEDNYIYDTTPTEAMFGIYLLSGADDNQIIGNKFINLYRAIKIEAGDGTMIIENDFSGCAANVEGGTNNKYSSIILSFTDWSTGIYSSSAGKPWGPEIDAATEYAIALGYLPERFHQLMQIRIIAVANVTEADYMTLEITGEGSAMNDSYTTESIDIATLNSTTGNFASGEHIEWIATALDDADIGQILGGYGIQIKVIYKDASGGACATDAIFICVIIEYV